MYSGPDASGDDVETRAPVWCETGASLLGLGYVQRKEHE